MDYNLLNVKYNEPYSLKYGFISPKAADLYYKVYGRGFVEWLENIDDRTAPQIVMYSLTEYNDIMNKKVEECDERFFDSNSNHGKMNLDFDSRFSNEIKY